MKVLFYNEYEHERKEGPAREMYPGGIHTVLSEQLKKIDDKTTFTDMILSRSTKK